MDMEEYPPPSDAADSDCRGPHGDSHIPGAYEAGDLTREEEFDAMQNGRLHSEFDINVSIFHHKHHGATTNHVFMPEFQPDVV